MSSLQDTSNESSKQDESIPHNSSIDKTQCSTDGVKDSGEATKILENGSHQPCKHGLSWLCSF